MVNLKICKSSDFIGNNAEKFNYDQFKHELKKGIFSEYPEEMITIEFVEQNTKFVEIETDNETLAQYIKDIVETIDISDDKFYD